VQAPAPNANMTATPVASSTLLSTSLPILPTTRSATTSGSNTTTVSGGSQTLSIMPINVTLPDSSSSVNQPNTTTVNVPIGVTNDDDTNQKSKIHNAGAIAAIVLGVILFIVLVTGLVFWRRHHIRKTPKRGLDAITPLPHEEANRHGWTSKLEREQNWDSTTRLLPAHTNGVGNERQAVANHPLHPRKTMRGIVETRETEGGGARQNDRVNEVGTGRRKPRV
jgi:hypothetical protein